MSPRKLRPLPSQEQLRELFDYDESGHLVTRKTGRRMESVEKGYVVGWIKRKRYFAHRLIWKWHHGRDPLYVDHLNGNKQDNRIQNLQSVSLEENARRASNNTLPMGVRTSGKKFRALAKVKNVTKHLGMFDTAEEASLAYQWFVAEGVIPGRAEG